MAYQLVKLYNGGGIHGYRAVRFQRRGRVCHRRVARAGPGNRRELWASRGVSSDYRAPRAVAERGGETTKGSGYFSAGADLRRVRSCLGRAYRWAGSGQFWENRYFGEQRGTNLGHASREHAL